MTLPNIDDTRRNEPVPAPVFSDLPARTPGETAGETLDQGSSGGRHFQDPLADDADDFNADDFEYVRINGVVRAIPKSSVADEPETATQNVPKAAMAEVVDPHFYVWLANGEVIRVKQSDLPAPAGTNAAYGHWQIDDKVFQIVNVYPVEDIVKGENA